MNISKISSLFKTKKSVAGWTAIGAASHGVYLAQIDFSGAMPKVARCEYHEMASLCVAELEKLKREADLDDCHYTTLLAPSEYQMLMVEAPNVPAHELKSAIRWKIKDGLNCHVDDATVDVLKIPSNKYGSNHVQSLYAIAAPNQIIQKKIALFDQSKIALNVIDIPETAQRNVAALFEHAEHALVLLSFDESGGLLTFTSGGELYFSRRIDISTGQLRDANEQLRKQYYDRVELELQRSLDYVDRQFNHPEISRILISMPDEIGLVELLKSSVEIPVERMELSEVLDISGISALGDKEFVSQMLPTLGAALRQEARAL